MRMDAMKAFIFRSVNLLLTDAPVKAPIKDPATMLREAKTALNDRSPMRALSAKFRLETNRLISRLAATISRRGTFNPYRMKGIRNSDPPNPTKPERSPVRNPENPAISNSRTVSDSFRGN